MRTVPLRELQRFVRETVVKSLIERIQGKDMPSGSSWHVAGKGWAAKNRNGVIDYFYGPDINKNKSRAQTFSQDHERKPEPKPSASSNGVTRPTKESIKNEDANKHKWPTSVVWSQRHVDAANEKPVDDKKEKSKPSSSSGVTRSTKESMSEASKYDYRIGGDGEGTTVRKGLAKKKAKSKKEKNKSSEKTDASSK